MNSTRENILRSIGLPNGIIGLSCQLVTSPIFEFRCSDVSQYIGDIIEIDGVYYLWCCGDGITACKKSKNKQIEYIAFDIETIAEFETIGYSDQAVLYDLFNFLYEDEHKTDDLRLAANEVNFRKLDELLLFRKQPYDPHNFDDLLRAQTIAL
jgi:hypothetical protein